MAIYLALFLIGLGFLVASTLLGHLFDGDGGMSHGDGLGHGEGADHGGDGAEGGGHLPSPFGPRTIAAAATGFGAGGGLALTNGVEANPSLGFAVLGGLLLGGTTYGFLAYLTTQQRSSHVRREDLPGKVATVITEISATGIGEVIVLVGGQTSIYLARSATGAAVATGALVRIEALAGEAVLVRPVDAISTES